MNTLKEHLKKKGDEDPTPEKLHKIFKSHVTEKAKRIRDSDESPFKA